MSAGRRRTAARPALWACCALASALAGFRPISAAAHEPVQGRGNPADAALRRARAEQFLKAEAAAQEGRVFTLPPVPTETPRERTDRPMDVLRYDLDLNVTDADKSLSGTVAVTLRPLATLAEIQLDLSNQGLNVASTHVNGVGRPFRHAQDTLTVTLATPISPGDTVTVAVQYSGTPVRAGPIGFGYDVRTINVPGGDPPVSVVATLSEPDGARGWWPCHDTPYDAAQVRLSVTAPDHLLLGSAGLKTEDVALAGGMRRQTWWMPVEIPAYLVSIAMSTYMRWTETAHVHRYPALEPVDLPVEYFTLPQLEQPSRATWAHTVEMIETFDGMFGPYPFHDLKYGMALFSFAGGMEHPTLSSMGASTISTDSTTWEWVVAHELSHQWFGDCVRLPRWGEVWLNEAFASYCEVLWLEEKHGPAVAHAHLVDKWRDSYPGTILDPQQLFGTTVYFKGAYVLHMLRQVMGREALIAAMRNYVTDPALRFQPVTTANFQAKCQAAYGADLSWFFTPWLTREGRPQLAVVWQPEAAQVRITVSQPGNNFYRIPLPLRLQFAQQAPRDTVAWVDGPQSTLSIAIDDSLVALAVDPGQDWLLDVTVTEQELPLVRVDPAYPNPFNGGVNVPVFLRDGGSVRARVVDARGRQLTSLSAVIAPRTTAALYWDGRDGAGHLAASGVYSVQVLASDGAIAQRKVTLIR